MREGSWSPAGLSAQPHKGMLAAVVSCVVLAMLVFLTPPASAMADPVPPTEDYPRLPSSCVAEGQRVPQHGVVCHLVPFKAGRPTVVLWGDSHAWMEIPGLVEAGTGLPVNLDAFVLGTCPPVEVVPTTTGKHWNNKCERSNYRALQYVLRLQRHGQQVRVLLGANWVGYRQIYRESNGGTTPTTYVPYAVEMSVLFHSGTPALFRRLGREAVDVHVVGQVLTVPRPADFCLGGTQPYVCDMPRDRAIPEEDATRDWVQRQMSRLAGRPRYFEVNGAVCGALTCKGMKDGIYTFFDDVHLSATRSSTLAPRFARTLQF